MICDFYSFHASTCPLQIALQISMHAYLKDIRIGDEYQVAVSDLPLPLQLTSPDPHPHPYRMLHYSICSIFFLFNPFFSISICLHLQELSTEFLLLIMHCETDGVLDGERIRCMQGMIYIHGHCTKEKNAEKLQICTITLVKTY